MTCARCAHVSSRRCCVDRHGRPADAGRDHVRRAAVVPLRPHRRSGADGGRRRRVGSPTVTGDARPSRPAGRTTTAAACRSAPTASSATAPAASPARGFLGQDLLSAADLVAPALPRDLRARSASATISSHGVRYRVYAQPASDGDVTVVAVPLREVDQNLSRLLLVEGLVVGARAAARRRRGVDGRARRAAAAGAHRPHRRADRGRRPLPPRRGDRSAQRGRRARARRSTGCSTGWRRPSERRAASEDRLRRFLADASHELRTPLASIRGYAELYRLGAARDPADVAKAMRRIEDESARMGVLVEDLLALARLDQVADVPHTDVDLATLARDAVDDARAIAPERDDRAALRRRPGRARGRAPAPPGARRTCCATPSSTRRRARRSR